MAKRKINRQENWFKKEIENLKGDPEWKANGIHLLFMECIWGYMNRNKINKKEMAKKAGMSERAFTRLSSQESQLTLLKMAKLAKAIGKEVDVKLVKEKE